MSMNEETLKRMKSRKDYYNERDVMQINSKVNKAKDSNVPFLNKKATFIYLYLSKNDIKKNYTYTLDSLTNLYRKEVENIATSKAKKQDYKFRKSFKSCEVVDIATIKSVIQYMYLVDNRQFEYYKNNKDNYLLHEVEYTSNLSTLADRK